mmetsp:Transcript_58751/g.110047  ORF Transcript_58751/g.110047 Transcript_58751/m.110047 type:complete len:319 (+) Transcript_58751:54-1010(+)
MTLWQRLALRASRCLPGGLPAPLAAPRHRPRAEISFPSAGFRPVGLGACRSFSSSGGQDPYKILGVDRNATQEEIKKAYKKEAMKWHPDKHPADKREEAQRRFTQLASAYETLSDVEKRREHDSGGGKSHGYHGTAHHSARYTQAGAENLFWEVFGARGFDELFAGMQRMHAGFGIPGVIAPGSVVKVQTSRSKMLALCREAKIDSTNDAKRIQSMGREGRVIKVDPDDNTAKVAVQGVGDVWFPAQTLDVQGGNADQFAMPFSSRLTNTPFGGEAGSAKEVEQRIVTKDGRTVMQIRVKSRGPDGKIHEVVQEVEMR